jgi:hypothetical protein
VTSTVQRSVPTAPKTSKTPIKGTVKVPVKKVAAPREKAPASISKASTSSKPKAVVAAPAKPAVPKLLKAKKLKLVRDSFAMPKLEYHVLEELKLRSGMLGKLIKKSELIRAGIKALASFSDANFLAALKDVPTIKTGRPAKK